MMKPEQGTMLLTKADQRQCYLVVDQEPRNWKEGVGVRELLSGGVLGPLRIFNSETLAACIVAPESAALQPFQIK